jgi:hypothetical protein
MSILNFMYKGEVNVNQSDLQHFLLAAEELHIKGLSTPPTVRVGTSVADPDPPDLHVFGPPGSGSGSIGQRYGSGSGSGSFYH